MHVFAARCVEFTMNWNLFSIGSVEARFQDGYQENEWG